MKCYAPIKALSQKLLETQSAGILKATFITKEINLSVADSSFGKSTSGGMLIFFFGERNMFSPGATEKRSAPWRASSFTPSK